METHWLQKQNSYKIKSIKGNKAINWLFAWNAVYKWIKNEWILQI